jgi:hypothetical protein
MDDDWLLGGLPYYGFANKFSEPYNVLDLPLLLWTVQFFKWRVFKCHS